MKKVKWLTIGIVICVMVLGFALSGCAAPAEETAAATTAAPETTAAETAAATTAAEETAAAVETVDPATAQFAFVLHVAIPFTESIRRGALNAGTDYGITNMEVVAPSAMDTAEQIGLFTAEVAKGCVGISLVAAEAAAWNVPINDAVDKGIIVNTGNCAAPDSKQSLYVGISGYMDGLALGEAIMNNPDTPKKGKIVLASCKPGLPVLDGRTTGVMEVLSKNPDYEIIGPLDSGLSPEATYSFWESAYAANPDMVMAVGSCAFDLPALYKFKQKNTDATFACVSYDLEPDALAGIKEGLLTIACGQGPYLQGYVPMAAIFEHLVLGNPLTEGWFNPGEEIVTKENVDVFIKRELDVEAEYEWYKDYMDTNLKPFWENAQPMSEYVP